MNRNSMRLIITFILLFVVSSGFGQSKEETQEWIAQKIHFYSYKDASSINSYKLRFENSQIIINNLFKRTLPSTEETYVVTYHVPINDILSIKFEDKEKSSWLVIETKSGEETIKYIPPLFVKKKKKNGFSHPDIFPVIALIDPELTYSMSRSVIINTGLDALAHSIEAYLSDLSFDLNDHIALEAIKIIIDNIENAVEKGKKAMNKMAYAAMLGGMVISHSSTILPHIMGYPLTTYHGLPHGRACIILQPTFINFLKSKKLLTLKTRVLDELFTHKGGLENFIKSFGVSTKLSDYGIAESELENFAKQTILRSDVKITPGNITKKVILDIYRNAL